MTVKKISMYAFFQCCFVFLQLMLVSSVHALPFTITPQGELPTSVPYGGHVSAAYIVTNNTQSPRDGNIVQWLPPNTRVGGVGCGHHFNLPPGGHCVLNLDISGAINADDPDPHHHLFVCFPDGKTCAGTRDPLNVAVTLRQQYAYIANANSHGNSVSVCKVNNNNFSECYAQTDPTFNGPVDVILNANASLAYVANAVSGRLSVCHVSARNGALGNCQLSSLIYAVNGYPGIRIINNYLYATDYWANTVAICPVRPNGTLGACTQSTGNDTFIGPNGRAAFNRQGTRIYVPNYWSTDSVSICQVTVGGSLSQCVAQRDPAIFRPIGAYMSPQDNYLYIANGGNDNHMVICPVSMDGSLGTCTRVTDPSFALGDYELNLLVSGNQIGGNQFLYVPNPGGGLSGNTLSICPIQPNGLLGACTVNTGNDTYDGLTSAWLTF